MTVTLAEVHAALDRVVDPCSNAMGAPLGLHEMGLAHDVSLDVAARAVRVTMRVTSPCCAYGPAMAVAAQRELAALDGIDVATVEIDHGAVWVPTAMTPAAIERIELRRRATRELAGVTPYDWTSR